MKNLLKELSVEEAFDELTVREDQLLQNKIYYIIADKIYGDNLCFTLDGKLSLPDFNMTREQAVECFSDFLYVTFPQNVEDYDIVHLRNKIGRKTRRGIANLLIDDKTLMYGRVNRTDERHCFDSPIMIVTDGNMYSVSFMEPSQLVSPSDYGFRL